MKQPTFFEGVAVALSASLVGSVLFTALTPVFAGGGALRLLIASIGLGYVVYLLSRSRERAGRITVPAVWALAAAATWLLQPALPLYVLAHASFVWLIRSLYFYSSLLPALGDLGLTGLSLAAAVWAADHSGSLFLSIWCFFLVQALFVAIPSRLSRRRRTSQPEHEGEDRFERAHRVAETAVRKLSSIR
jgi:hypothetical protein